MSIAKSFLAEYAKLENHVKRAVEEAIDKFAEHTHAGLHLEKIQHARAPASARSGSPTSTGAWWPRPNAATGTCC